jgi:NADH:ubiquinone oxidoreductase subunit 6 (subunit J)
MDLTLLADAEPSYLVGLWPVVLPVALGAAAVYLLLPRARPFAPAWGALAAALAVLSASWLLVWGKAFSPEVILFYAFAGLAIVSGGLLVTQRNPVHAALSFALVVLSTCGLFLLQAAPFLMAATIIVYAGAIVVTFLFVIMLAQQAGMSDADHRSREPLFSSIAAFVLLGALLYVLYLTYDTRPMDRALARLDEVLRVTDAEQASRQEVDAALNDDHLSALFGAFADESKTYANVPGEPRFDQARQEAESAWNTLRDRDVSARRQGMKAPLTNLKVVATQLRDSHGSLQPRADRPERFSDFSRPRPNRPLHELPYDPHGRVAMPADNVGALGRALFTDYLVPVELGGTLLLVATVGAIAIANRRKEGFR